MKDPHKCASCDYIAAHDDLPAAKDVHIRAPGEDCPDVECPECCALCYPLTVEMVIELCDVRIARTQADEDGDNNADGVDWAESALQAITALGYDWESDTDLEAYCSKATELECAVETKRRFLEFLAKPAKPVQLMNEKEAKLALAEAIAAIHYLAILSLRSAGIVTHSEVTEHTSHLEKFHGLPDDVREMVVRIRYERFGVR